MIETTITLVRKATVSVFHSSLMLYSDHRLRKSAEGLERRARTMFGMIVGILFGVYVIAAVINVAGVIIGAVFSGIGSVIGGILSGAFSGESLAVGIMIGTAWYLIRKRNESSRSKA